MKKEEFEARTKRYYTDDEFDVIDQIFDIITCMDENKFCEVWGDPRNDDLREIAMDLWNNCEDCCRSAERATWRAYRARQEAYDNLLIAVRALLSIRGVDKEFARSKAVELVGAKTAANICYAHDLPLDGLETKEA